MLFHISQNLEISSWLIPYLQWTLSWRVNWMCLLTTSLLTHDVLLAALFTRYVTFVYVTSIFVRNVDAWTQRKLAQVPPPSVTTASVIGDGQMLHNPLCPPCHLYGAYTSVLIPHLALCQRCQMWNKHENERPYLWPLGLLRPFRSRFVSLKSKVN